MKRVDVGDAVLEQVADARGVVGEQLARVGLLDVLREHEHADPGQLGADLLGGAQALVGVGRRHAHVDDRDVGLVGADLAQQVLGVAGLADDLEAGLLEQAHDALAQQHRVVGDDDPHRVNLPSGIAGSHDRPAAVAVGDAEAAVERGDPVGEARAGPSRRGSAPPTPSSATSTVERAVAAGRRSTEARVAPRRAWRRW